MKIPSRLIPTHHFHLNSHSPSRSKSHTLHAFNLFHPKALHSNQPIAAKPKNKPKPGKIRDSKPSLTATTTITTTTATATTTTTSSSRSFEPNNNNDNVDAGDVNEMFVEREGVVWFRKLQRLQVSTHLLHNPVITDNNPTSFYAYPSLTPTLLQSSILLLPMYTMYTPNAAGAVVKPPRTSDSGLGGSTRAR